MAVRDGSLRSRAASLLPQLQGSIRRSRRRDSTSEKSPISPSSQHTDNVLSEKETLERSQTNLSSAGTIHHTSGTNAVAHNRQAQRIVRSIPPWVHTRSEDDESIFCPEQPPKPQHLHVAHHNTTPSALFRHSGPAPGRLHDHERECVPPVPRKSVLESGSRWKPYMESCGYPALSAGQRSFLVDQEYIDHNFADYSQPWLAGRGEGDAEDGRPGMFRTNLKRRAWYQKLERRILRSPIVPMIIRMTVFGFSMIALALACSIHHIMHQAHHANSKASTIMAIVVDAVAMVYLTYITYDEYSGKPLGLRPVGAKLRLIFLDLFFIVFDSANLSLAFETLEEDDNTCKSACVLQSALASVLLIALVAWLMTFSISILRLIARVHHD